jgi:SAM-dependent methyltransferase
LTSVKAALAGASSLRTVTTTPETVSPRWEHPQTVAGFKTATPNENLLAFAQRILDARPGAACLDLGCGAARNALPLARMGFRVCGTDLSEPMLRAARERIRETECAPRIHLLHAPMAPLPFPDGTFDLVVAHGIWNLARSGAAFRAAVAEASRVARPGAGLFLFTFSRDTLPPDALPDAGETFVFSSWNGEPQCFLTAEEIDAELGAAGFHRAPGTSLAAYNVRPAAARGSGGPPAIYEGTFFRAGGTPSVPVVDRAQPIRLHRPIGRVAIADRLGTQSGSPPR